MTDHDRTGNRTEDRHEDRSDDAWDLTDRLLRAIETGDVAGVAAVYADDVAVWHNHDDREEARDENLRILGWLVERTTSRCYDDVRREHLPPTDGATRIVQRHVLRLTFADGRTAALPACLFVTARDGRITRIEEYLDQASATRAFTTT